MRARALIGKTIRRVVQARYTRGAGAHVEHYALDAIEFTDGTVLRFIANETEGAPTVSGIYPGRDLDAGERAQ